LFRSDVASRLGFYVYRLVDPRDGRTFYVGKGTGNRVFAHAAGELREADAILPAKNDTIRAIRLAGMEVEHHIHRHGMDEATAFHVEAALIDAYSDLTNLVRGHQADEFGTVPTAEIIARYQAPPAEWQDDMLLVGVNRTLGARSSYSAARFAWKLNRKHLPRVRYVLAVRNGLIVDAFRPARWLDATLEHFPDATEAMPGRVGFEGEQDADAVARYVWRRLPDGCNLSHAGIRYVGPSFGRAADTQLAAAS
jgi:hypothetical protein